MNRSDRSARNPSAQGRQGDDRNRTGVAYRSLAAGMVAQFNEHPNSSGKAHTITLCPTLLREEADEALEALAENDRAHIARELADVVYVAYTAAWAHDINLDAALAEIHRAAMSKMVANVRRPSDGKIIKHPGFVPPNMEPAIGEDFVRCTCGTGGYPSPCPRHDGRVGDN